MKKYLTNELQEEFVLAYEAVCPFTKLEAGREAACLIVSAVRKPRVLNSDAELTFLFSSSGCPLPAHGTQDGSSHLRETFLKCSHSEVCFYGGFKSSQFANEYQPSKGLLLLLLFLKTANEGCITQLFHLAPGASSHRETGQLLEIDDLKNPKKS